jgi:V-type H+-transporting ATPase subunit a
MRERRALGEEVQTRLDDLSQVLGTTREHLRKILSRIAYQLNDWQVKVTKIKAIYHTMNKFSYDKDRSSLIGNCWCPTNQLGAIREALRQGAEHSGTGAQPILTPLETKKMPPTYHVTNKFTGAFQAIVDAYGVASYQEVNPGPFTIITFPFLFAVMFGDLGHGAIMFLFALFLVKKEVSLAAIKGGGEIWDTIFGGRYILLLMGLFSMYTGFLYNDCFSKAMTIIDSGWELPNPCYIKEDQVEMMHLTREQLSNYSRIANPDQTRCGGEATLNPCDVYGCFKYAYPIGIDPIWMQTSNKLSFTNSYKMKMSVIMGVLQMAFGTLLSFYNGRYFKRPDDVYHVFIPQITFLLGIFGYLVLMIFKKWLTDPADSPAPGSTPSLLLMLINMFLSVGSKPEPTEVLYGDAGGTIQGLVQVALVLLCVICVPWMLLVKPLKIKKVLDREKKEMLAAGIDPADVKHEEGEQHDFSEIMVHQAIHTIEFCLGCISNTASYLRLWALSLAHAELSEVLWEMVLEPGLSAEGAVQPILIFAAFAVWAVLTICVLLIMEGLSAFLHALRLHWVEFQNKFYEGVGYLFHPFSFELIIESGDDELD